MKTLSGRFVNPEIVDEVVDIDCRLENDPGDEQNCSVVIESASDSLMLIALSGTLVIANHCRSNQPH